MKKVIINEKNENGLYTKTTTTEKTPEDGFVYENTEHIATSWSDTNHPTRSVWHKGYAKKFSHTTNDPRITRPFAYAICGIFLTIGIFCLLLNSWFFGIVFTAVALFAFYDSKKDIDAIEEDLRNQGHDMDSESKKEEVRKEFVETIKNSSKDAITSTFTKKKFKYFVKQTIPIYCFIAVVTSLLIMIFVNIFLGIFVALLLTAIGVFYYYIISKIFKH
jgi:hypothetical protein